MISLPVSMTVLLKLNGVYSVLYPIACFECIILSCPLLILSVRDQNVTNICVHLEDEQNDVVVNALHDKMDCAWLF